ncbi:hypothetical protein HWV62_41414 [Athelia sp. TMB]|nr:hypothetical protein HWV62_41414 [Athelia sp. TMB]
MSTRLTVSFTLDVDAATTTVSALKELIAALGKDDTFQKSTVTFKGHELRDARTLEHYGVGIHEHKTKRDESINTIQLCRPTSQIDPEMRITLRFKTDTEHRFSLTVNEKVTVAQLKREIAIEERLTVRALQGLVPFGHAEETLKDDAVVGSLELQDQVIAVTTLDREAIAAGKRPVRAADFDVRVSIDERGNKDRKANRTFAMHVSGSQTLAEFEDAALCLHMVHLADYALILDGVELKHDEATLDALNVRPGCTIYAVADVSICVSTANRDFDMVVSPMTRLSTVRSTLERIDPDFPWEEFAFSTGYDRLPEDWTMWDLGFMANTMMCLKRRFVSLVIFLRKGSKRTGPAYTIEADERETVESMKRRIFAKSGVAPSDQLLLGPRDELLTDDMIIGEERAKLTGHVEMIDLNDLGED